VPVADRAVLDTTAPGAWQLEALYASPADPRLAVDLDTATRLATDLAASHQGRLAGLPAAGLAAVLDAYEECLRLLQRVDGYLELFGSTGEPVPAAVAARCDTAWAAVTERAGFIEAELAAANPAALHAQPALAAAPATPGADPVLDRHRPLLARVSSTGALPADQERVLARLSVTGQDGWSRLGRQLLARVRVELAGEQVGIPVAIAALRDRDPATRERVHAAASRALEPELDLRATALAMVATDLAIRSDLRGLPSWLSQRHQLNQVDPAEIDRLLEITEAHLGLVHDYFAIRAALLGRHRDIDRYAPVGAEPTGTIDWPTATGLVVEAFAGLAAPLGAEVRAALAGGRVDALPRPGKSGRPFTRAVGPADPVYVSVSFTGRPHDALVLAHELGHAVHLQASAPAGLFGGLPQPVLAETVALFFEGLTAGRVDAQLTGPAERVWFLGRQLDTLLVTPLRQAVLHGFEDRLHRHAATQGPPDADELSGWWLSSQRKLYGPGMDFGPDLGLWWSCLDSFLTAPGSLYSYVYGGLAAAVLLARHRAGADPAGLLALMAAGSTRTPAEAMRLAGVDARSSADWTLGFSFLAELLADFRAAAKDLQAQPMPATRLPPGDSITEGGGYE
jgi:oligoendopeptidase F